jgi:hypothetical protein
MSEDRTALWGEILQNEADSRHEAHKNHASSRPLSEGYELIGLLGEAKFGQLTGLMPDLERKLSGDNGIDFIIPLKFSVDVKTARKPKHLIQERGKISADIYVLAGYDETTKRVRLLGWEWGAELKRAPVKDFGYGIFNHYIPVDQLKPMEKLTKRI